jgi:hypothetical protein
MTKPDTKGTTDLLSYPMDLLCRDMDPCLDQLGRQYCGTRAQKQRPLTEPASRSLQRARPMEVRE